MGKDTINPKRWILTQEQIDAYVIWKQNADEELGIIQSFGDIQNPHPEIALTLKNAREWLAKNPCPLPNPVEIPTKEKIRKEGGRHTMDNHVNLPFEEGAMHILVKLGLY